MFFKYASGSRRARALSGQASPEEWALHRRTYAGGCNTARSVLLVVKTAVLFFEHCMSCCGGFLNASEFQVAAWVSSYARRGKTTGNTAKAALRWVEAVTGEHAFAGSPLVKCHSRPQRAPGGVLEPTEPANPPGLDVLRRLEHLVTAAPTAVQRCLAGFFVLLAFSSSRTADLLRTRPLTFTRQSLTGESIMKQPKGTWVRWYSHRQGLVSEDWAGDWMFQFRQCGLPGADHILTGFNIAVNSWLPRLATYHDLERGLRVLLVTQCNLSVAAAAELTPMDSAKCYPRRGFSSAGRAMLIHAAWVLWGSGNLPQGPLCLSIMTRHLGSLSSILASLSWPRSARVGYLLLTASSQVDSCLMAQCRA